ncbi:hypothetical protein M758_4G156600 [Ceratodon purpureus]|nr:hypothetical protein M758_4G156600 [Ceratodon purpureus]
MLIDSKPLYGLAGSLAADSEMGLWREGDLEPYCISPQAYFTCGASSHCSFVSPRYGTKCPRHQKKMTTQCKMMDCGAEVTLNFVKHDGFVKSNSKYFVTDNLEIYPSSKSLALLQKLNVENMSSLDSIDLHVGTDEVLQMLRASLTSGNVLTEVFAKSLRNTPRGPHQEIPSQHHNSNSTNLLQKKDQASEDFALRESMEIARDWGRGLYSALKEVQDTAFHSSLVHYVKEREHRIGSALRDLASAPSEISSRPSSFGTGTRNNKKIRGNGDLMPKPCKEMLMLEKQVDKVMARLCHLISSGPSLDSLSIATKPKPPPVKPPWTMYQPSSRIRPPSAPLAGMRHS